MSIVIPHEPTPAVVAHAFSGGEWRRLAPDPLGKCSEGSDGLVDAGYVTAGDVDRDAVVVWESESNPDAEWPFIVEICAAYWIRRVFVHSLPDLVMLLKLLAPLAAFAEQRQAEKPVA